MESRISDYAVASGGAACVNAVTHDVRSLSGWNASEPSSRLSSQNQMNDDVMEMEQGWTTSYGDHTGVGPRLEERKLEPTSALFAGRRNFGHSGDRDRSGPSLLLGSSSSHAPQSLNLNAGYMGNSGSVGALSGNSGFMVEENNDDASLTLGGWGLSCKRKALEGTSGQYCSAGSSSCFQQGENHASACYDTSSCLSLSPPLQNSLGFGMRAVEDCFPSSGSIGNTENCRRSFGRIGVPGHQQESVPFHLSSRGTSGYSNNAAPHSSQIPLPFSNSLELRSTGANTNAAQNLPQDVHVSAFTRNVHRFPWSGASSPRANNLSSSFTSGERDAALQEEGNTSSIPRNNAEQHPMFVRSVEMRNMAQDPTSWGLATGSSSGGIYLTAQVGSNSSSHPSPPPAMSPHHNYSTHSQQRLSEFSWPLFPSAPQNPNLNAGYVGNNESGGQGMGTGLGQNPCNSSGLETEQESLASAASDKVGTSSRSSGFMVEENNGDAGSSLGGWGLSCKRKALEGTSAQSCSAGTSSCFPLVENGVSAHNDPSSSLSLSLPLRDSPTACPLEQSNPRFGVGMRIVEDGFPPPGITGNSENCLRSFGRRGNPRHRRESVPFSLLSRGSSRQPNIASPHSPALPLPYSASLGFRSAAAQDANINAPQIQPHPVHVSSFSRNMHHFPWRGASSSRAGSLSISSTSGERGATLREEGNARSIPRNNAEHSMYVSSASMGNMVQDPANWGLVTRSSSGDVSSARIGSSSSIHPLPGSAWIPHPIPSTHSHRLMSEIRQVLTAMHQGENLRIEDFMLFEPFVYHGLAEMHDRHRDMRLDVDNMSYEELLALEERIGDVSTGLSEETIMKIMKREKYVSTETESPTDLEPCCICQEEYTNGDDLGVLDCGHNFHTDCIKLWLMQKNLCPICKTTALPT